MRPPPKKAFSCLRCKKAHDEPRSRGFKKLHAPLLLRMVDQPPHHEKHAFTPTALHRDISTPEVPSHLSYLLSYGGKLTAFHTSAETLCFWKQQTRLETHRLEKNLLWS